ncbi:MAG: VOC family protein [Gammaproteobacteria bacterium]|nr:MAG: VOC family protein [Gammaproteobacteria bacterium]
MTEFLRLHHASVIVTELATALRFYVNVLGLPVDDSRPDMGFPGAWLEVGEQQIHLLELPNCDPVAGRPGHAGRDRHTAFLVTDLATLEQRLEKNGISFSRSRSGRRAIFCRDPDGNGIELIEAAVGAVS